MKFEQKFPNAEVDFEPKDLLIFKSVTEYPCDVCKEKTTWISMSFEAPVCSEECLNKLWKEYNDYCEG